MPGSVEVPTSTLGCQGEDQGLGTGLINIKNDLALSEFDSLWSVGSQVDEASWGVEPLEELLP